MSIRWVIYYSGGKTFSNRDGDPWDAPRSNVLCIAQANAGCGREVLGEQNYYCWHFDDDCWVPHDTDGLIQYLDGPGCNKVRLRGYWIRRERYFRVRREALKGSNGLPPVTANQPRQPEGEIS